MESVENGPNNKWQKPDNTSQPVKVRLHDPNALWKKDGLDAIKSYKKSLKDAKVSELILGLSENDLGPLSYKPYVDMVNSYENSLQEKKSRAFYVACGNSAFKMADYFTTSLVVNYKREFVLRTSILSLNYYFKSNESRPLIEEYNCICLIGFIERDNAIQRGYGSMLKNDPPGSIKTWEDYCPYTMMRHYEMIDMESLRLMDALEEFVEDGGKLFIFNNQSMTKSIYPIMTKTHSFSEMIKPVNKESE